MPGDEPSGGGPPSVGPPDGGPPGGGSARGGGSSGFGRSPRWLWLALILGLVVIVGVIVVQRHPGGQDAAGDTEASGTEVSGTEASDTEVSATEMSATGVVPSPATAAPAPYTVAATSADPSGSDGSTDAASGTAPERPVSSGRATATSNRQSLLPSAAAVRPHLLGVTGDWEIIGYGSAGLVRVRPATGKVTVTPVPSLNSGGPLSVVAAAGTVIIRPFDHVPGYAVPDGGPATELAGLLQHGGPVFPGPHPGEVWVPAKADGGMNGVGDVVLVDTAGRPTGPRIRRPADLPYTSARSDGAGYLLYRGIGGVYEATPTGFRLVTHGSVLAVGPTTFLVYDCDEQARCGSRVIDRETRQSRSLRQPTAAAARTLAGTVSADGSHAALLEPVVDETGAFRNVRLHLINLESGRDRTFGPDQVNVTLNAPGLSSSPFVFSPDGTMLLAAGDRGILAVDTDTGQVTALPDAIPQVDVLVLRTDPAS